MNVISVLVLLSVFLDPSSACDIDMHHSRTSCPCMPLRFETGVASCLFDSRPTTTLIGLWTRSNGVFGKRPDGNTDWGGMVRLEVRRDVKRVYAGM